MAKHDVAYYCIEYGIAQKLKPLVVERASFLLSSAALVHESQLVVFDMMGIETENVAQRKKKLLFFTEREPQSVNKITLHIS